MNGRLIRVEGKAIEIFETLESWLVIGPDGAGSRVSVQISEQQFSLHNGRQITFSARQVVSVSSMKMLKLAMNR